MAKEYTVSKKAVVIWFVVVVVLFCAATALFFGYHARGKAVDGMAKKLKDCKEAKQVVKKPQPKVAKRQVVKTAPPVTARVTPPAADSGTYVPARVPVPALAPSAPAQFALRINVVEWASVFAGKSLMSRDIGSIIRQGLANGTVVRTKIPLTFKVNGREVSVPDGQVIIDPGPIGPETALVVQPFCGSKFASPPNGLPLVTNPGELDALVKRGVTEIWLNFILDP